MAVDRGVGSWIERRARITPERVAIVHGATRRTYAELASRIRRLAHALRALGVQRGDRVMWLGANHPAFLEVLFACGKIGAVFAPMNHLLPKETLEALVRDFSPRVAFVHGLTAPIASVAIGPDYEKLLSDDAPIEEDITLADLFMLPHSSGTTGMPKGIMLTHGNVTWNVVNFMSVADFRGDDVTVAIAPLFRTGGHGVNVLPVLFKGGTVVVPEKTTPDEILRIIETERVTIGFGNPDLLETIARSPRFREADLSSIRVFMTGGAPVPERLLRTYLDRGITFLQGYGLSEAAPLVLLLDAESAARKVGSAGKPPLFVDVRVVRADGSECDVGETGELLARGPNVTAGFWNRPAGGDGWLRTGDAARIDDEGYVWIVDRVADAYDVSGGRVYPGEVEQALKAHAAVLDAGAVSIGGRSVALVVLAEGAKPSEAELLALCRARLPAHAVPSVVRFVERVPRSSVGKMLRRELAVLAREREDHGD